MRRSLDEREEARRVGSATARLQYPSVDLQRCIGCGSCVRACPEEGVLDVIHGQALVVHGARCVGHGRCADECPVGAIALTLGDLSQRKDIPVLTEDYGSPEVDGLYLAGEVTGFALIRTAVEQGREVGRAVAERIRDNPPAAPIAEEVHDLIIVGAGPAGISCGLQAKLEGLDFLMLDQDGFGGTVARYPRRKLVMTQPVELPLHGEMKQETWTKEELVELWQGLRAEHDLPVRDGVMLESVYAQPDGFALHTNSGVIHARNVCLALGRRGTPRRLNVPGEDLPKVAYSLLDAQSYRSRRILVVGGGDSAVEAAMGLAEQPGNRVSLSYRKSDFFRIKSRNQRRLKGMVDAGALDVLFSSDVQAISAHAVELRVDDGAGGKRTLDLPNDEVFIMAGGVPPMPLLEQAGVSFDHAPPQSDSMRPPSGLLPALAVATTIAISVATWSWLEGDYYGLSTADRPLDERHGLLRASQGIGLAAGFAAVLAVLANLAYLLRRSASTRLRWGSLRRWMTSHVATGLMAFLFAALHAGFSPRNTVGGHAFWAMFVVVLTGALGRYLYSFLPRAANGRELEYEEIRAEMARLSAEWDRGNRDFGLHVRDEVTLQLEHGRWHANVFSRAFHVISGQIAFRRRLGELYREGVAQGIPADELANVIRLARRGFRTALAAAHFGDLRALLASWRFLHRWVALFLVLLIGIHVYSAVRYGDVLSFGGGR